MVQRSQLLLKPTEVELGLQVRVEFDIIWGNIIKRPPPHPTPLRHFLIQTFLLEAALSCRINSRQRA